MPEQTLDQRLSEAQRDARGWREKLEGAEAALTAALAEKDYAAAEKHKATADAAREPLLIAEAHVQALQAGVQALADHQQRENLARQERERREQAEQAYHRHKAEEERALEELGHLQAELKPAYQALRQVILDAMDAEERAGRARIHAWHEGTVCGMYAEGYPKPPMVTNFATRIQSSPVLGVIWRSREPS